MSKHVGKTVREILLEKKGSIKDAELEPGSPSWDEILDLPWEEVVENAKHRITGFKTFKKLLGGREFDK